MLRRPEQCEDEATGLNCSLNDVAQHRSRATSFTIGGTLQLFSANVFYLVVASVHHVFWNLKLEGEFQN